MFRSFTPTLPHVIINILIASFFISYLYWKYRRTFPAYVIHLKSERSRDKNAHALCKSASAQIFFAVDGSTLNVKKVKAFVDYTISFNIRHNLRAGEIGCLNSHYSVWRLLSDRGGICLEDDALLTADNARILRSKLIEYADESVIFLGFRSWPRGMLDVNDKHIFESRSKQEWVELKWPNYSTACYALTSLAARALVDAYQQRDAAEALLPADDFLSAAGGAHHSKTCEGFPKCVTILYPRQPIADLLYDGISRTK